MKALKVSLSLWSLYHCTTRCQSDQWFACRPQNPWRARLLSTLHAASYTLGLRRQTTPGNPTGVAGNREQPLYHSQWAT